MNDISVGNILETDGERLLVAVRNLLEAKGLLTTAELAERRAITDAANPGQGARMVAKAWTDPARTERRTIHHHGYGRFVVDGETITLESKMP